MGKVIPVFPLDLVLFPRQELPLKVFEPRYKQLVDDCMVGDGQFGVCLVDGGSSVLGWEAPRLVGTMTKITGCRDVGMDGLQLHIDTVGRNPFRIKDIIPPEIPLPVEYDPLSAEGHAAVASLYEAGGSAGKMYIRAEVEMVPEVDGDIPLARWEGLVGLWKRRAAARALPRTVEPRDLDAMLRHYYLVTDSPTPDYLYSLCALGAGAPAELQPLLEARDIEELLMRAEGLLAA